MFLFINEKFNTLFFFPYYRCTGKGGGGGKKFLPVVPAPFVHLVYATLYKLVGLMLISKDLVNTEFFGKLRTRFQNASKKVNQNYTAKYNTYFTKIGFT